MTEATAVVRPRAGDVMFVTLLGVVSMLFAGFTAAYFIRSPSADWARVTMPSWSWVGTGVLLASSITVEFARRRRSPALLHLSIVLGLLFLGAQYLSWEELSAAGVYLPTSPHGAFYFMLSAVHAVHLLGGLGALIFAALRRSDVRLVAGYWHFMGLVWVYTLFLLAL